MSYFGDPLSDKWEYSPCFDGGLNRPYEKFNLWHVSPDCFDNNYRVNTGGRRKHMATVRAVGGSMVTTEAVARRMACAPELLEALEEIQKAYGQTEGSALALAHAMKKAIAAIKKAKGGL